MRATSAASAGDIGVRRLRAFAFMPQLARSAAKPECISAASDRARARTAGSRGQPRPASSQAYSQIASESQIRSSPSQSTGTRRAGLHPPICSLNCGVSSGNTTSSKSSARCFNSIHGRSDHDE